MVGEEVGGGGRWEEGSLDSEDGKEIESPVNHYYHSIPQSQL